MNIVMTLEMAAECHPDRVAVRCGDLSLSYAQWLRAAKRAAGAVRASGCAHLALLDVNSPAASVALYAAAYAGVPFVPLNYRLTKPEIEALLARIVPAFLVADPQLLAGVNLPVGIRTVSREQFLALAEQGEEVDAQADAGAQAASLSSRESISSAAAPRTRPKPRWWRCRRTTSPAFRRC